MSAASSPHPIELLSAFVDGEVSSVERRLVESHLTSCGSCAKLLREMEIVSRAASAEEVPPLPAHMEASVKSRLGTVAARSPGRAIGAGWRFRIPLAAAAAVAGALALWVAARGFRGPTLPEEALSPQTRIAAPREPGTGRDDAAPGRPGVPQQEEADEPPAGSFAPAPPLGKMVQREEKQESGPAQDQRAKESQSVKPLEARPATTAEADDEAARPGVSAKDARAPAAPTSFSKTAPAEVDRRLTLRQQDGLAITLLESGHLRVEGSGYGCSVSLLNPSRPGDRPEVVTHLFQEADRALGGAVQDVPSPHATAAQPPPGGSAQAAPERSSRGASLSLTGSNGVTHLLAGPGMEDPGSEDLHSVAESLRSLALETHRRRIEEACGPLPRSLDP